MFEMDLEKDIMTSGNCEFIVRLHGTLTDLDYYYFLMGKLLFNSLAPNLTKCFVFYWLNFRAMPWRRFDGTVNIEKGFF